MTSETNVERALNILLYIAKNPGSHGIRELSKALDLTPSTVSRLVTILAGLGFLEQDPETSRYIVGVQTVQLGVKAMESFNLTTIVPVYLQSLVAETGESAFMAVMDSDEIVYLIKHEGIHAVRTSAELGSRRPMHSTALGKAMLAMMPQHQVEAIVQRKGLTAITPQTITTLPDLWQDLAATRVRGYAIDDNEMEEGLVCYAAPILNYRRQVVGATSMAGPGPRMRPNEHHYGPRVALLAAEISRALGYTGDGAFIMGPDDHSRLERTR